jgi:hypothetical protein
MPASSGDAKRAHEESVKRIRTQFSRFPDVPLVTLIATDGDRGYSHLYRAEFQIWFPIDRYRGIVDCHNCIRCHLLFYVTDFLY